MDKSIIVCPHCHEEFELSNGMYMDIVSQVRTQEFNNEIERMRDLMNKEYDSRIQQVKAESELVMNNALIEKSTKIAELKSMVDNNRTTYEYTLQAERDRFQVELAIKDEQIAQYRDFKMRMSTKMVGESLERYCENEFNKVRAMGFASAYFEKDNDARTGSKGDYIFRDSIDDIEYISIMFEMKNEMDDTEKKHKNEDFLKELDKDRREKGCEYAVLVSMLEADNDFYNQGIVDMSHRYEKMYVIRPQFFIPLITILRNAAQHSIEFRKALLLERQRNVDVTTFEESLDTFKLKFNRNMKLSEKHLDDAVLDIEKTINRLQKVKTSLESCRRNIQYAGGKLDDLTIRKLTRNNITMTELFEQCNDF